VAKAEEWLCLHTTLGQLHMISRNRRDKYNHLWHQAEVCRTFSSDRHWECLNKHSGTRYFVSGLKQCVLKEHDWASDN